MVVEGRPHAKVMTSKMVLAITVPFHPNPFARATFGTESAVRFSSECRSNEGQYWE